MWRSTRLVILTLAFGLAGAQAQDARKSGTS
jgi:hypothetical protein